MDAVKEDFARIMNAMTVMVNAVVKRKMDQAQGAIQIELIMKVRILDLV